MSHAWMPLYVGDYLGKTQRLTTVEHGAYMLLIMEYWQSGGLPDDDAELAIITRMSDRGWKKMRTKLATFFNPGWQHDRIDEELAKADAKHKLRVEAGQRGGKAKAEAKAEATALPEQKPSKPPSIATPEPPSNALASSSQPHTPTSEIEASSLSSTEENSTKVAPSQASGATLTLVENEGPDENELPAVLDRRAYPAEFEVSWKAYLAVAPKNATKADAHRGWTRLAAAEKANFAKGLLAYIAWFAAEVKRDQTTKIKHLATFIAKRGWEPFLEVVENETPVVWVPRDDPRFEPAADRVEKQTGKRPQGYTSKMGKGYYFPAELVQPVAA